MPSRVDPWEQQVGEPKRAFIAFAVYRDMPRAERSLRRAYFAYTEREVTPEANVPGSWFEQATEWKWRERVLAYDRAEDRRNLRRLEASRMASLVETAELGRMLRMKAQNAAKMLASVTQKIGEHEGKEVVLVSVNMTPGEIAKMAQVGAELEQMAMQGAAQQTGLNESEAMDLLTSDGVSRAEVMKRLKEIRQRRELASVHADDESAQTGDPNDVTDAIQFPQRQLSGRTIRGIEGEEVPKPDVS